MPFIVKDMSRRGISVQTEERLEPGSSLHVLYVGDTRVPQRSRYESCDEVMTVLWSAKAGDNHISGLKFNNPPEGPATPWLASLLNAHGLSGEASNYRRKNIRVSAEIPVTWRVLGSEYEHTGSVRDISLDGVLISTERRIPVRENLWLRTGSGKSFRSLISRGTVVRSSFDASTQRYLSGIRLERLNEEHAQQLRKTLTALSRSEKRRVNTGAGKRKPDTPPLRAALSFLQIDSGTSP